jgi:hypothetical protein
VRPLFSQGESSAIGGDPNDDDNKNSPSDNEKNSSNISYKKMYQLGQHFFKHGREMGYSTKYEYDLAARQFANDNLNNPNAQIFEGTWNGRGINHYSTQLAISNENKTLIIDKASRQIIDFYNGTEMRGLINLTRIQ